MEINPHRNTIGLASMSLETRLAAAETALAKQGPLKPLSPAATATLAAKVQAREEELLAPFRMKKGPLNHAQWSLLTPAEKGEYFRNGHTLLD